MAWWCDQRPMSWACTSAPSNPEGTPPLTPPRFVLRAFCSQPEQRKFRICATVPPTENMFVSPLHILGTSGGKFDAAPPTYQDRQEVEEMFATFCGQHPSTGVCDVRRARRIGVKPRKRATLKEVQMAIEEWCSDESHTSTAPCKRLNDGSLFPMRPPQRPGNSDEEHRALRVGTPRTSLRWGDNR